MPRQIFEIKTLLQACQRGDASSARIKKTKVGGSTQTKFKIRTSSQLLTLVVHDQEKAEKLKQSLPPTLTITETPKKNAKGKRVAKS